METVVVAIDESKFAQFALKCTYTSALYAFIVYNVFKFIKCMPFVVEISIFPLKMVQIGDHGILFMNVEVPGSTVYQQRYPSIEKYGYHFLFT